MRRRLAVLGLVVAAALAIAARDSVPDLRAISATFRGGLYTFRALAVGPVVEIQNSDGTTSIFLRTNGAISLADGGNGLTINAATQTITGNGGVSILRTVYGFGVSGVFAGLTRFFSPFGTVGIVDTVQLPIPAGTLRNLRARLNTAPGGTETLTVTVNKNGVNTAVTCTLTGAATTCTDVSNTVAFAAGDGLSFQYDNSAGSVADSLSASIEETF